MLAHGLDPERGILALRPAEVRADADPARVALEQQLQRRQRGTDARVVSDLPSSSGTFKSARTSTLALDVRVATEGAAASFDDGSSWKSSSRLPDG